MIEEEEIIRDFRLRERQANDYEGRLIGPSESDPTKPAGGGIPVYEPPQAPPVSPEFAPEEVYRSPDISQPSIMPISPIVIVPKPPPTGTTKDGPTSATTAGATAPKKNLLDSFFDWLNNLLSGL